MAAAAAIMTTDTVPKACSRRLSLGGKSVTVTGIAKGAGMIHPNMATMLGFVATDAAVSPAALRHMLTEAADALVQPHHRRRRHLDQRFLHADRDRRRGDAAIGDARHPDYAALARGGDAKSLSGWPRRSSATAKARPSSLPCRWRAARRKRNAARSLMPSRIRRWSRPRSSPPTPTWAGCCARSAMPAFADLDVGRVQLHLGDVLVAKDGGRNPAYREEDGQRVMQAKRNHGARGARPREG